MKLITLNTWGGRITKPLLEFIQRHADADIFCFQEVRHRATDKEDEYKDAHQELFSAIAALIPKHIGHFHPHYGDHYGLALFHKKEMSLISIRDEFVHRRKEDAALKEGGYHPRNIQLAIFKNESEPFAIVNFHGLWNGKGKEDSPDRIVQSRNIFAALQNISGEIILAGDFNLLPQTESLKILESSGLKNLIKEYGITNTRTSYYSKADKYADYVLVSPGVKVIDFKVLPEEVSDHAALELEFEI